MKEYELRDRTKMFALRIIRMYCRLPKSTEAQVLENKSCVPEPALPPITGRHLVRDQTQNSLPNWALSLKSWMRRFFG